MPFAVELLDTALALEGATELGATELEGATELGGAIELRPIELGAIELGADELITEEGTELEDELPRVNVAQGESTAKLPLKYVKRYWIVAPAGKLDRFTTLRPSCNTIATLSWPPPLIM